MDITVIGSGYVGLVVGACLADTGNRVIGADLDEGKVERLRAGQVPIYEPGLDAIIARNLARGRLSFTTDVANAVRRSAIVFIAVGTPPTDDGGADLDQVLAAARTIGENLDGEKVVITKSTVPVGTAALVRRAIEAFSRTPFHVCSNPEFLKEGAAVHDFMRSDRVVCGIESDAVRPILTELYEPFVRTGNPLIFMDIESAELTKYAANAMLATRISFINQIAALCDRTGADIVQVQRGIGSDPRIGPSFLFAGLGYGGSCFPKDVKALIRVGEELGVDLPILRAVHEVNERQKGILIDRIRERLGADLRGRRLAIWGLAFKPGTDDMRAAPSLEVIAALRAARAEIVVHDPVAMDAARRMHLGETVTYAEDELAACEDADALVILTEWQPYRRPDWDRIRKSLRQPVVFDGRNIYDPGRMAARGFEYYSIGRRPSGRPGAGAAHVAAARGETIGPLEAPESGRPAASLVTRRLDRIEARRPSRRAEPR